MTKMLVGMVLAIARRPPVVEIDDPHFQDAMRLVQMRLDDQADEAEELFVAVEEELRLIVK